MPEPVQPENTGTGAGESRRIDPDSAERCPRCGATSIYVHGLRDCPNCSWIESTRRR